MTSTQPPRFERWEPPPTAEQLRRKDYWAIRSQLLSATRVRLAVLAAVRSGDHWTTREIEEAARSEIGSVSTQGVYDALDALSRVGLVRRIESAGSPVRYEISDGEDHDHLVCRRCRAIVDVTCAAPPLLRAGSADRARGFFLETVDVTFWGVCRACRMA